jgi:hypothetical protein
MEMSKPDFLIVGGMKCGTTSLGFHLQNHLEICFPHREPHFFDNDKNFRRGEQWYKKKLSGNFTDKSKIIGEKTPAYSYFPKAAQRIHTYCPDVKLVWIFREPVARAYSNYIHAIRTGFTRLSFTDAVSSEQEQMKKNIVLGTMERSRYHKQVSRFLEFFDKDQMHFMLFEEFIKSTRDKLDELFQFLGVSKSAFVFRNEVRGKAVLPRWQASVWAARQLTGRSPIYNAIRYLNVVLKKPGYDKLTAEEMRKYKLEFRGDNQELARLTGLDLSVWE